MKSRPLPADQIGTSIHFENEKKQKKETHYCMIAILRVPFPTHDVVKARTRTSKRAESITSNNRLYIFDPNFSRTAFRVPLASSCDAQNKSKQVRKLDTTAQLKINSARAILFNRHVRFSHLSSKFNLIVLDHDLPQKECHTNLLTPSAHQRQHNETFYWRSGTDIPALPYPFRPRGGQLVRSEGPGY